MFGLFSVSNSINLTSRPKIGETLREKLRRLYSDHTVVSYQQTRVKLYNTVDCEDNKLWMEYSNERYDWTCGQSILAPGTVVNAEHSIPKVTFASEQPMYTDLHHLITAPAKINNARSNMPFGEFDWGQCVKWCKGQTCTKDKPSGSMEEYDCIRDSPRTFMPRQADRGRIARMVFYFYTMYPDYPMSDVGDINTFKSWNSQYPPDDREIRRNNMINQTQGNRNPYIDDPSLVNQAW